MARASVGSLVVNILGRTQEFSKSFGKVEKDLDRFARKAGRMGKQLTAAVTLPIAGIGIAATKMALDFDTAMNKMVSLVGLAREDVDAMRSSVIAMASDFGKSATEAADAMFFITSAGLRGAEAMQVLETSLKASAVGLGEVKTIADLLTSTVNAYGSANISAAKAGDILTAAVREGKLEASELAGSIGNVLPLASAMGISFEEVAAAFAAMSRTGTDAATAATQLRGIMSSILQPTAEAEKTLSEFGLSSAELRDMLKEDGLLATLETLTETFGDNDTAIASVFGNVRALTGVLDLMGANAEGTREIFEALGVSTGMLDEAFKATEETAAFRLQKALGSLKNSLISIGEILLPLLESATGGIQKLADGLNAMSPKGKEAAVVIGMIAAAIGPALVALGLMAKGFAVLKVAIVGLTALALTTLGSLVIGIVASSAAVALLAHKFLGFKEIGESIGEWLVSLGFDTEAAWLGVGAVFDTVWGGMKELALSVIDAILAAFIGLMAWVEKNKAKLLSPLTFVADGLAKIPGIGKLFGGDDVEARATGGPVSGGSPYLVGEQGPELFVPNASGSVVNNGDMSAMGGNASEILAQIRDMLAATYDSLETA